MCTAQLSPSSSGLVSASLCPSEDAKEAAWEEQLPSAGLVCGHRIDPESGSVPKKKSVLTPLSRMMINSQYLVFIKEQVLF